MKPDLTRLAGIALREAVTRHVEKEATPQVCGRIKREFVLIMRDKFGVDWSRYARQIKVEFIAGSKPNLIIPPRLLKRTVH
jgi:NADH:ubiquinone oxidoreductase subunit C